MGDYAGTIRVGSLDNWAAATVLAKIAAIMGVLVGQDGSFVTTDTAGNIKLWRNGTCEVTLTGGYAGGVYLGIPLAMIGRRLVVVGGNNNLLVAE